MQKPGCGWMISAGKLKQLAKVVVPYGDKVIVLTNNTGFGRGTVLKQIRVLGVPYDSDSADDVGDSLEEIEELGEFGSTVVTILMDKSTKVGDVIAAVKARAKELVPGHELVALRPADGPFEGWLYELEQLPGCFPADRYHGQAFYAAMQVKREFHYEGWRCYEVPRKRAMTTQGRVPGLLPSVWSEEHGAVIAGGATAPSPQQCSPPGTPEHDEGIWTMETENGQLQEWSADGGGLSFAKARRELDRRARLQEVEDV